jgi:predicted nicotinamide N-methyase
MRPVGFGSQHAVVASSPESVPRGSATVFVRANTRPRPVPHVPEIMLHLADEAVPLWQRTEEELSQMGLPPPFWAFAWAGGQALARYVLDYPTRFAAHRVLDLASGSGLVAIAAAKAGAARVAAADIDAFAIAAIELNAAANGVVLDLVDTDLLVEAPAAEEGEFDVILAADIFYDRNTAERAFDFLVRCRANGAVVLIGDPGRTYLPKERLVQLCEYNVPVTRELEDQDIKRTCVWTLA